MAKRIREVYPSDMVAHLWAHQSQDRARNGRNFSFDGPDLYSYTTRIGRMVADKDGNPVALISLHTYSHTTAQQINSAEYACRNVVPVFRVDRGFSSYMQPDDWRKVHAQNVADMLAKHNEGAEKAKRCNPENLEWRLGELSRILATAKDYASTFSVDVPAWPDAEPEIREHHEKREAKRNDPKNAEKNERARLRRIEKIREDYRNCAGKYGENRYLSWIEQNKLDNILTDDDRTARQNRLEFIHADRIGAWRDGAAVSVPRTETAMLRVVGDNVQTSWGVSFPIAHGKRAFPLILQCREQGREWITNGHSIPLGHFKIDRIGPDGTVRAGCHTVKYEEVERIARQLGLIS